LADRAKIDRLALPGPCDGVIWFGNLDWWYHNRGHASVRMATRVGRLVPTVWINSIGMRVPVPGRTDLAWTRVARKLRSMFKGLQRDPATGMWIYTPWFVPHYSAGAIEFNGTILSIQVTRLTRRLGMRRPSACVSMPTMTPAVERLHWVSVVFDRCDDFTTLPEADAELIAELERRLLNRSDHAVYVNDDLFERERRSVADAQFIGHGVDFDQFAKARPIGGERPPRPAAISALPRPIVGFFGGMDEYRMDEALMLKIARRVARGSLLLVGPEQMDLSRLKKEPNVHHVGRLLPEQLPEFAAHFDVGVIPFLQNDFNRASNPTKLKEYLALGYPVVAMRLPAFEKYADVIRLADSHEAFLDELDSALTEDDAAMQRRRRELVAGDSWDRVAQRVAELLGIAQNIS
jgi:glycosyltransferase involved in cell wall biosynthesis